MFVTTRNRYLLEKIVYPVSPIYVTVDLFKTQRNGLTKYKLSTSLASIIAPSCVFSPLVYRFDLFSHSEHAADENEVVEP